MNIVAIALAVLVLGLAAFLGSSEYRWRACTTTVAARLQRLAPEGAAPPFTFAQLDGLPAPVVRYFRAVLREGQPMIRRARLRQHGQFLVRPAKNGWSPFEATQDIIAEPAGFVWDARIRMAPGLAVRVRDAFVDGEGSMVGTLMGVKTLIRVEHTPEIAAGALQRYLAEAAWLPTALLPASGVSWTPVDDSTARASLSVEGTTASLDFHFGADGLIRRVYTAARARALNGRFVPTPWQGRWLTYEERGGMRVPVAGEVEWLLPEGPQVYWRARVTEITHDLRAP